MILFGFSGPIYADGANVFLESVAPKEIIVKSDGKKYVGTVVPFLQLDASVVLDIDAGLAGRVKSYSAYLSGRPVGASVWAEWSGPADRISQSFSFGNRPKTVATRSHISVSYATLNAFVAGHCNMLADELRKQGKVNTEIFSTSRSFAVDVTARVEASYTVAAANPIPSEVVDPKKIGIVCEAYAPYALPPPPPPSNPARTQGGPALLKQLTMVVVHPTAPVQCPVEATAHMVFRAEAEAPGGQPKAPGKFSYRVRSLSGKVSHVEEVTFSEGDRSGSSFSKTILQKFMVGAQPAAGGAAPGHPGLNGGQASGFTSGAASGGFGPLGAAGRPGGGSAATGFASGVLPTPPNVHKDSLWIDIVSAANGSIQKSDYREYTVTCQAPPSAIGGQPTQMTKPPTSLPALPKTLPPSLPAQTPSGEATPAAPVQPPPQPGAPSRITAAPTPIMPPPVKAGEAAAPSLPSPQPPSRPQPVPLGVTAPESAGPPKLPVGTATRLIPAPKGVPSGAAQR